MSRDTKPKKISTPTEEDIRRALGKVDQYRIMKEIHLETEEKLKKTNAKLAVLEASGSTGQASSSSSSFASLARNNSITQRMLDAANMEELKYPTEFFQEMENEKNEEIESLKAKALNSEKHLEKAQQREKELEAQILTLKSEMRELEQRSGKAWSLEPKRLEETTEPGSSLSSSSSWENVNPREPAPADGEGERETAELRRRIDELQERVAELLHHNAKWNTLCADLQQELDRVRGQLQQYQTAETDTATLLADLKVQTERREEAERVSQLARRQIEELEQKVSDLERQLEEKEQQERAKVDLETKELSNLYEEQLKIYKEDFENERKDHGITKSQLDSMKQLWQNMKDEVQNKTQQLRETKQQSDAREKEMKDLQQQLDQARNDRKMIKAHADTFNQRSKPGTLNLCDTLETSSLWSCSKCTFDNHEASDNCKICESPRETKKPQESTRILPRAPQHTMPRGGTLEEDGIKDRPNSIKLWSCNRCTYINSGTNPYCDMCAQPQKYYKQFAAD